MTVSSASRRRRAPRLLAIAGAVWLASCGSDEAPAPGPSVEAQPPDTEAERSPYDGIDLPPFEPLPVPPPEIGRPTLTPVPSAEIGRPKRSPAPPATLDAESEEEAPPVASLDALLAIPVGDPLAAAPRPARGLDLATTPPEASVVSPETDAGPGTFERLRQRVRVDRRSDAIGPKGPRQGKHTETDAGVDVPLDEGVTLQGGVRVDERDEPGAPVRDRKSTPRVGVEVRF